MTFLNAALAFGAVACSIPLIIHLLNRSRFNVIPWGAMHLLEPVIRVNRRRIRLEQLILLLVRMAILALLAFCMAAPVLTGWRALSGDAKTSFVLLFDNSYSMEAGGETTSNLTRAKQHTSEVISRLPRGSDLSIVLMAGGTVTGSNAPTTDLPRVVDDLRQLPEGFGGAEIAPAIERAAKSLGAMQHAKRDVVIVSDFQKSDWAGDAALSRDRAMELIKAMPLQPTVSLMHVGAKVTENACVRSLHVSPDVVGLRQEVQVRANLRNYGKVPYPSLRVYLRVDGRDEDSAEIDLGAAEDGQVLFRHTFDNAGSHFVEVFAEADALGTDNRYLAAITVWDSIPVLLVNGDPSDEPLRGETDFLEIALTPFVSAHVKPPSGSTPVGNPDTAGPGEVPLADLLQTTSITRDALAPGALVGKRVLVLANVSHLSQEQLEAVQVFVRDGNSLLIFPGSNVDTDWYNGPLRAEGNGLLPLEFSELKRSGRVEISGDARRTVPTSRLSPSPVIPVAFSSSLTRDGAPDAAGTFISSQHFDHSALELFNDPRNGSLADAEINVWYRLDAAPAEGRISTVLARLESGDPYLVEKLFGRGRVIQCATACDDAWSNLPARAFYVPLMQRLVTYLAASVEPPRNVNVGETIAAKLPDVEPGTKVTITPPGGQPVELSVGGGAAAAKFGVAGVESSSPQDRGRTSTGGSKTRPQPPSRNSDGARTQPQPPSTAEESPGNMVEYANTERPGLYTLEWPGHGPMHFVVSSSRDESDLAQLEYAQLQELGESLGASVVSSAQQYLDLDSTRRYGREIWRQLFWAMLVLVFSELLLQQFFARRRGDRTGKR